MKTFIAAAFASLAFAATPAAAEELATTTISVSYADLDLTAPAGQATLEGRVSAAIQRVCGKPDTRNLKSMTAWQDCTSAAREQAASQVALAAPFADVALASRF